MASSAFCLRSLDGDLREFSQSPQQTFGFLIGHFDELSARVFLLGAVAVPSSLAQQASELFERSEALGASLTGGLRVIGGFSFSPSISPEFLLSFVSPFFSFRVFLSFSFSLEFFQGPRKSPKKIPGKKIPLKTVEKEEFHHFQAKIPLKTDFLVDFRSFDTAAVTKKILAAMEKTGENLGKEENTAIVEGKGKNAEEMKKSIEQCIEAGWFNRNSRVHTVEILLKRENSAWSEIREKENQEEEKELKDSSSSFSSCRIFSVSGFLTARCSAHEKISLSQALAMLREDARRSLRERTQMLIDELDDRTGFSFNNPSADFSPLRFDFPRRIFFPLSPGSDFLASDHLEGKEKKEDAVERMREILQYSPAMEEIQEIEQLTKAPPRVATVENSSKGEAEKIVEASGNSFLGLSIVILALSIAFGWAFSSML